MTRTANRSDRPATDRRVTRLAAAQTAVFIRG